MSYLFGTLYWIFSWVTILTAGTGRRIRCFFKPLTIPLLGLFYFSAAEHIEILVLSALFFSFLGDLLLLGQSRKRFFISGLFAFLAGHIAYAVYFFGSLGSIESLPRWVFLVLLLYGLASLGILRLLSGKSRILKVPVIFYIIIISGMNFSTLCRLGSYSGASFWFPFIGSLLYLLSDTLLGIRNFKRRIPQISRVISITYHLAQFFLILGVLNSGF